LSEPASATQLGLLPVELVAQGATEEAAHFAYRAHRLQRTVFRQRRAYARYAFSLLLDVLAGFGYRPVRTLAVYLATVVGFGVMCVAAGASLMGVLAVSVASFHGTELVPSTVSLGGTQRRSGPAQLGKAVCHAKKPDAGEARGHGSGSCVAGNAGICDRR
jgi:hypothetical protein